MYAHTHTHIAPHFVTVAITSISLSTEKHWLHPASLVDRLRKKVRMKLFVFSRYYFMFCKMLDVLSDFVSESDMAAKPEKPAPSLSYKR